MAFAVACVQLGSSLCGSGAGGVSPCSFANLLEAALLAHPRPNHGSAVYEVNGLSCGAGIPRLAVAPRAVPVKSPAIVVGALWVRP